MNVPLHGGENTRSEHEIVSLDIFMEVMVNGVPPDRP
jgi:hypothetical protein